MPLAIATYEAGDWKVVRPLSDEDGSACVDAIKKLHKFESDHSAFVIADTNGQAYEQSLEGHIERISRRGGYHPFELHVIAFDANRHVCNFLASFSAFLNQSERIIRDQFRSASQYLVAFKKECQQTYDSSQAYRILYALRNFAQHYAMPITGLKGDVGSSSSRPQVIVGFHPADLLSSSYKWRPMDRTELETLGDFADLTPMVSETREKLRYLFGVQLSICSGPYLSASELLAKYMSEVGPAADRSAIVATNAATGVAEMVESDWFPATTVRRLEEARRRVGTKP